MINSVHVWDGLRIFKRSVTAKLFGIKEYEGDAEKICEQVIDDCWDEDKQCFKVSKGHFYKNVYMRDFGWTVDSLMELGYGDKVHKSLEYMLKVYSSQRLTTTINDKDKCADFFEYSPDSLAFLVRSLVNSKAWSLIHKYNDFLVKESKKFEELVIDKKTGLVYGDKEFSSMKDHSKRKSSTYDNVMAAVLARELPKIGIETNMNYESMKKKIKEELWNGEYFFDDMTKQDYVAGDANVFTFFLDVFDDEEMLKSSVKSIQKAELDKPFPLKYTNEDIYKTNFVGKLVSNYEGNAIWMHMGPLYVSLLKKVDKEKAQEHKLQYRKLIEKHKNFLEVFTPEGEIFKTIFYYADEGMSWAANYLTL